MFKKLIKYRFKFVRVLVGLILANIFQSIISNLSIANLFASYFFSQPPSILFGATVTGFFSSIAFAFGWRTRVSAGMLLVALQIAILMLPILESIHYPILSAILFIFVLYDPSSEEESRQFWQTPLMFSTYFCMTISGLAKLEYPGWRDGNAVRCTLTTAFSGPHLSSQLVDYLPLKILGLFVLFTEILSLPLLLFRRTRVLAWLSNSALQLGIFLLMDIKALAGSFLLVQILILEPAFAGFKKYAETQDTNASLAAGDAAKG